MNTWSQNSSSSYTDRERRADVIIQWTGLTLATGAVAWLIVTCRRSDFLAGLAVYGASLVLTLSASLIYSHLSSGRSKELWRRVDHAMIFALIAGTYTPLAAYRLPEPWSIAVLAVLWSTALIGIGGKFLYPRRFEYIGLILCIVMGLTGVFFIRTLLHTLLPATFALLVAGIVSYLLGTVVLQLHRVRFHNAIWHFFVLAAAGLHFAAMALEFAAR